MSYALKAAPSFKKDFKALDAATVRRVAEKLRYLSKNPKAARKVRYTPRELAGLYKYRIGDWRALFWLDRKSEEIVLYAIEHRNSIYKRFR